uniref:Uncharacterized protein n=1 Tax=Romanomermis culicivorax TaxID=13658 RepID=A0A915J5C0_ROMCU
MKNLISVFELLFVQVIGHQFVQWGWFLVIQITRDAMDERAYKYPAFLQTTQENCRMAAIVEAMIILVRFSHFDPFKCCYGENSIDADVFVTTCLDVCSDCDPVIR